MTVSAVCEAIQVIHVVGCRTVPVGVVGAFFCGVMGKKKASQEDTKAEEKWVDPTPPGQKKDLSAPMADSYIRERVESAWDAWWTSRGFYGLEEEKARDFKDQFVMVIPPPNVTGSLHLGHALMCSVEDVLTRFHRMNGKATLWVPGVDHAGIATQVVVEKMLWKTQGKTRHDIGREAFVDLVWKWKEEYGGKIFNQIKRLGCSADWNREAFTMNENFCDAVNEAFIRMFQNGKIYRANRLVNWSCELRTAISNVEVEPLELKGAQLLKVPGHARKVEFGVIHSFAYKVADSDEEIIVATTRIETMLGDVAVAVHPEDPRYKKFHGKKLRHPFHERLLEIVLDPILVNMEFGTGAVKITPAHDPNDFECGKRHGLVMINILTEAGKINHNGGKFEGMMRYDARWHVLKELEALGLYRGKDPNPMVLGICQRSGDVVEPLLKPQWWVDCSEMAKKSCEAVKSGTLQIIPSSQEKTWFNWLENIQDWCISRQLWWGHRIPAYRVLIDGKKPEDDSDTNNWVVAKTAEEALALAQKKLSSHPPSSISLEQDEDVLDTWFSAGLFPFAVFGWPKETNDLKSFYPTSLLETGHDILFFWVARMVMMGIELTGKLPFKQIFLHPMVRDKYGRKMSKSLGNVVDPLDVIEGISLEELHAKLEKGNLPASEIDKAKAGQKKDYPKGIPECGADALRFTLMDYMIQERNINLDVDRVFGYRQFCNKLWNATKFCIANLGTDFKPCTLDVASLDFSSKWIISRLAQTAKAAFEGISSFQFNRATSSIYSFWMKEFCAVFMETSKPAFQDGSSPALKAIYQNVLYTCLDAGLKLLHPFMPFVTEELWQRLPGRTESESIMISSYPKFDSAWIDDKVEEDMKLVLDIVHAINSSRDGLDIPKSSRPEVFAECSDENSARVCSLGKDVVSTLGKTCKLDVVASKSIPSGCVRSIVSSSISLHLAVGVSCFVKLTGIDLLK